MPIYSLASIPDFKKSSISIWEFLTIEEVSKLVSVMRVHRSVVFLVVQTEGKLLILKAIIVSRTSIKNVG